MNLDDVIPNPQYRMCHSRNVDAPPTVVWDELLGVTMSPSGLAGIKGFFHEAVELATRSEGKGCLIAQTAGSAAALESPIAKEIESIMEVRKNALRHALRVARQKGELRQGDLNDLVSSCLCSRPAYPAPHAQASPAGNSRTRSMSASRASTGADSSERFSAP